MNNLEQSKDRLKIAFMRIENVTQNKVQNLKIENEHLKIEIIKLKQQIASALLAPSGGTNLTPNAKVDKTNLVDSKTSSQIDLSLSELKKLVK